MLRGYTPKSFEGVIKSIGATKGWKLPENANAANLVAALFDNGHVPNYMQNQFSSLRSLLQGSVPTTRNKTSGHGQGKSVVEVTKSLAALQLHQTASIILFLSEL